MAAPQVSERRARYTEALLFWAVTLVVCAGAGYGSYRYGRSWIGNRPGGELKPVLTSDQLSSRIRPEVFEREPEGDGSDASEEPPKEAVVDVKAVPLAPEDRERLQVEEAGEGARSPRELEQEQDEESRPQDEGDELEERPRDEVRTESTSTAKAQQRPPSVVRASDEARRYVVRAGAFRTRRNAQRMVEQLRAKGYSPYLTTAVVDGVEYTRVNVASYESREEALKLRGELRGEGYRDASIATE